MKMNFSKKLLVASVIAAVGNVANAATPTLGEVLKASNIDVVGYIDVSYNYLSTDQGSNTYRAYDTERRSFNLHAVDITISSLPENGFGGLAELTYGQDADFNGAIGTDKADKVDPLQAFIQYQTGPVAIIAGKFTTLAGAEVAQQPNNTNFSRSLLYTNAIPVTHTGARGTFTLSDKVKLVGGYNNGWDILQESNASNGPAGNTADGKTIELGVLATPVKLLTLAASYYTGEEYSATSLQAGDRNLLDVVATFNITDAISVVVNVDKGEQENATAGGGKAKWDGMATYFNYKLNDTWRLSARVEEFKDKNCFRTTCPAGESSQKLEETTLTVGYVPAKNAELRAEVRRDESNRDSFTESGASKKKQNSFGVEALLKF